MIAVTEILGALKKEAARGTLDRIALKEILGIYKLGSETIARKTAASLNVGQRVQFVGRHNALMKGWVKKINRTSASVAVDDVDGEKQASAVWRVAATLLSPAEQTITPVKSGKKEKVPA